MQDCQSLQNHFYSSGCYKIHELQSNKMSQKTTLSINHNKTKSIKTICSLEDYIQNMAIPTTLNHHMENKMINPPSFQAKLVQSCAIWHSGTMSRSHGSLEHPGMTWFAQVAQNIPQTSSWHAGTLLACWHSQTDPWHRQKNDGSIPPICGIAIDFKLVWYGQAGMVRIDLTDHPVSALSLTLVQNRHDISPPVHSEIRPYPIYNWNKA